MSRRVVVTGIGMVTPLGCLTSRVWDRVLSGLSGIGLIQSFRASDLPVQIAGEVPRWRVPTADTKSGEKELAQRREKMNHVLSRVLDKEGDWFDDPHSQSTLSRSNPLFIQYALEAASRAVQDSGCYEAIQEEKRRCGVAIGVGMSSIPDIIDAYDNMRSSPRGYRKVSPHFVPRILPNLAAGHVAMKFGLQGPNHTASTACAAGAHAIGDSYRMIKYGDADVMLAGGAESSVNSISIVGFSRLRALASNSNTAETAPLASRPFDKDRSGFVMGEGSAVLVLESLDHAKNRNARIYCEISGYGMSGDAFHITAPHPDGLGSFYSMQNAVNDSGLDYGDIGYINAHATSTPVGDEIEAGSISKLFSANRPNQPVMVSSTKGATGHLLGASGALEAAFSVLALRTQKVPPTLNFQAADFDYSFDLVHGPYRHAKSLGAVLSNSFGFGGTNASLVFNQVDLK